MLKSPQFLVPAAFVLGIAAAIIGVALWDDTAPAAPQAAAEPDSFDQRAVVALNPEQKHYALTQMRGFLTALGELDEAEFAGDLPAMRILAAAQAQSQTPPPAGFQDALPPAMRQMSKQMRQAFAAAASAAEAGNLSDYAAAKQAINTSCIGCHESYRFELAAP